MRKVANLFGVLLVVGLLMVTASVVNGVPTACASDSIDCIPTPTKQPPPTATDVPPPTATDVPPPTATEVPLPTPVKQPKEKPTEEVCSLTGGSGDPYAWSITTSGPINFWFGEREGPELSFYGAPGLYDLARGERSIQLRISQFEDATIYSEVLLDGIPIIPLDHEAGVSRSGVNWTLKARLDDVVRGDHRTIGRAWQLSVCPGAEIELAGTPEVPLVPTAR